VSTTSTKEWPTRRLKFAATINDEALSEDTDPDYEFQYLDIGNVDSLGNINEVASYRFENAPSRARRRVTDGDVIISTVRTYLQAIASIENPPENLIVSTGFAVVRPRDNVLNPRFCKYALRDPAFLAEVGMRSVGVNYPAINASEIGDIHVHLPPLPRQTHIAAFLDRETSRLDALVAAKQTLIDLLAEKRRALITRAVTRGLNPDVPLNYSGLSWLGSVPVHWKIKRLKHISPFITVGVVVNPTSYVTNEGVPFLFGSDVTEEGIDISNARQIPPEVSRGELAKTCLHPGDIVTVRVGYPGVTAVVPQELEGANCASMMLARGDPSFDSKWLAHVMNSRVGRYQFEVVQYGAAQEQFNIGHAVDFQFPVPPLPEQRRIVTHIETETARLDALRAEAKRTIELLKERRSALIAAAVTGELEVN
jgi:type I restriction enzyme S subunit